MVLRVGVAATENPRVLATPPGIEAASFATSDPKSSSPVELSRLSAQNSLEHRSIGSMER